MRIVAHNVEPFQQLGLLILKNAIALAQAVREDGQLLRIIVNDYVILEMPLIITCLTPQLPRVELLWSMSVTRQLPGFDSGVGQSSHCEPKTLPELIYAFRD